MTTNFNTEEIRLIKKSQKNLGKLKFNDTFALCLGLCP